MHDEHCEENLGSNEEFTTTNYNITTTPKKEYEIAKGLRACSEEDKKDKTGNIVRRVQDVEKLANQETAVGAKLILLEVLTVVCISF